LVFNKTFRTNRLYRATGVRNIYCVGPGKTHSNINKQNEKNINAHFNMGSVEIISPEAGVLREVFLTNHLASTDNLTTTSNICIRLHNYCSALALSLS